MVLRCVRVGDVRLEPSHPEAFGSGLGTFGDDSGIRPTVRQGARHALGRRLVEDFATLTVTREQTDGDQASSGKNVLVGSVDTRG